MSVDGSQLVQYLQQFLGTPYQWGGNSLSSGVDCSGLVQQGLAHFGISVPRTTYEQIGQGSPVAIDDLKPGDLVFFDQSAEGPGHVGVYAGNGMMIEAPHTGANVRMTNITTPYYVQNFAGARRIDGVTWNGQQVPPSPVTDPATMQKLSPQEMASQFGWNYAFLKSNPELAPIFDQAVQGSWSNDKFQAALKSTNWYQTTSDTARQGQVLQQTDPATFNANVSAAKLHIQDMAAQLGAPITDAQMNNIAQQSIMMGMNDEELKNTIGQYVDFVNGTLTGTAGLFAHNMQSYARSMGVSISDQSIKQNAAMIARGLSTEDDYKNFINEQAKSLFPAYTAQIDGGQTMDQIANPYVQTMAQTFEMNPGNINLTDPTIMRALNGLNQQGQPVGQSITDFQNTLRGDPRWNSTQQAQDQAMALSKQVLTNMGVMSG